MTGKGPSQAEQLAEIADERYTYGCTPDGEPYALHKAEAPVARPLRGRRSLRAELAALYLDTYGRPPTTNALGDVLGAIEGRCARATPQPLHLRLAERNGTLYLDLGRQDGEAIRIDAVGWRATGYYPIVFRRTALTGELPDPVPGGDLARLRELLNVSDQAWPLVVAWLVASLIPDIPHPILGLQGEQGTGKTSAARMIVSAVDPSSVPVRTAPRDVTEWGTAASGSWTVALDNVSSLPDWLSDALCRAVTGDGIVRRALYTDNDLSVMSFRRCVIMTTIDPGALAGDLADRLLAVDLERIPDNRRSEERELAQRWAAVHPEVLGGLLDLLVEVRAVMPAVVLPGKPRMADFAVVLAAVDKVLGTSGYDTYSTQRGRLAREVLEGDPVATAIGTYVRSRPGGSWTGTPGALLAAIDTLDGVTRSKRWPATPRGMTGALTRAAPAMRAVGWTVDREERQGNARPWTLRAPSNQGSPDPTVTTVTTVITPGQTDDGSNDGSDPTVTTVTTVMATVMPLTSTNDGPDGCDGSFPQPLTFDIPEDIA